MAHAEDWILYAQNLGSHICIDEVALSRGELYTVVTNGGANCQKGALVAMIKGTKSDDIISILSKIPLKDRVTVKEVTVDLAPNMERAGRVSFPESIIISDRFHVQQLPSEALQEMRIKYRWKAIEDENNAIKEAKENGARYIPKTFENGDTPKQLLARSRYVLFKPSGKWTENQKARANILFQHYPDLNKAYDLSMSFRGIYEQSTSIEQAKQKLENWYDKVKQYEYPSFITAAHSIKNHEQSIVAFFRNRTTNALAETFNSKIKAFRSVFRGVRDIAFFLYRVALIFA